jgi:hypothetical protein
VAVVGVTFGAVVIERRRVRFGEMADYHDGMMRHLRSRHANTSITRPDGAVPSPRRLNYHDRMAKNYRLAASQPWLPVEPDSPARYMARTLALTGWRAAPISPAP